MNVTRRTMLGSAIPFLAGAQAPQDDWQGVKRVVAVGDVHGDRDALVAVLKMAALLDEQERWSGGRAHLVQIGDIPSRGPQCRQAMDFLMRLEQEALAAGGRVHALIGNHDAGVIYGDLRNVLPEEYGEFKEPGSEERLVQAFDAELAKLRRAGRLPADPAEQAELKRIWFERHPPGFVEHREAFGSGGRYGSWIRQHNAVLRINETLFVHGGISPKHARRTRSEMNTTIRRELANPERLPPGLTTDTQGPLWYRGLAEDEEAALEAHLQGILRSHGVRRIVIGHTVTRTAILPRFGSRVVNIDLGLSRFYGRPPACLILETGSAVVIHAGTRIPLPDAKPGQLEAYLQAVVKADVQPSPVERLLHDLR
jgi:hypothetical protein